MKVTTLCTLLAYLCACSLMVFSFRKPRLQVQIIRIIWMVPVYSLESLLSVHFEKHAFIFQVVREIYESYVIYCFMRFLLNYLGNVDHLVARLAVKPSVLGHHKPPFCFLAPWQMGHQFLTGCKMGVLQCVVLRFGLTLVSLGLHFAGCYEEGDYSLDSSYLWMTLVNCVSQTYALYALFLFYHVSHSEFRGIRPFEKFLSIKLVIFFSWWQALFIGVLMSFGQIGGIDSSSAADAHSAQEVADGIQDLLISMEMFFAAIAFTYSFSVAEFRLRGESATIEPTRNGQRLGTRRFLCTPTTSTVTCNRIDGYRNDTELVVFGRGPEEYEATDEERVPLTYAEKVPSSVMRPFHQDKRRGLTLGPDCRRQGAVAERQVHSEDRVACRMEELQGDLFFAEQSIDTDFMFANSDERKMWDNSDSSYDDDRKVSGLGNSQGIGNDENRGTYAQAVLSLQEVSKSLFTPTNGAAAARQRALQQVSPTPLSSSVRTRVSTSSSFPQGAGAKPPPMTRSHGSAVEVSLDRERRQYTLYEALYLTLFMGELRGDLVELATLVIDEWVIAPSQRLKRWMKASTAVS